MLGKRALCKLLAVCITIASIGTAGFSSGAAEPADGNLYRNGDFETGDSAPWSFGQASLAAQTEVKHSGQYAAYFSGKPGGTSTFRQRVQIEAKKTYLASSYVLADSETKVLYECYPEAQGVSVNRPFRTKEQKTFGSEAGWQRVDMTLETGEITGAGTLTAAPINWQQAINFYVDDLYLGELRIADIVIDGAQRVSIPKSGTTVAAYTAAKILNQLGTDTGLYEQTVSSWRLKEAVDGVSIAEDGTLTVQPEAAPGVITIQAVCVPSYLGASQAEATGEFAVELLAPGKAQPKATDVQIAGKVAAGNVLSGSYHYEQEENEPEGETAFRWLYSDSADGVYQPIPGADAQTYTVEEEYENAYLIFEVVPVTADGLSGNAVRSAPVKKVQKATGKNLYTNPGFETGDIAPWSIGGNWLTAADGQAYEGQWSGHVTKKPSGTSFFRQYVAIDPNKTYLASGMVLSTSDTGVVFECYPEVRGLKINRPYRTQEQVNISKSDGWKRVSLTIETGDATGADTAMTAAPMYWDVNTEHYVDALYLGELVVADIEIIGALQLDIPESGSVDTSYRTGKILNQLGTDTGLYKEQVKELRLKEPYAGVSMTPDGVLTVTNEAVVGDITIEAVCIPSFLGADGEEATGELVVSLTSASNPPPYAKDVTAQGTVAAGQTLTGAYQYMHRQNHPEGNSVLRWLYSDSADGVYQPIPGAVGASYVVGQDYADYFIAFEVTVQTADGQTGNAVRSAPLVKAVAPTANDVAIRGDVYTGASLTGVYAYYDYNGDAEGETTFRWLRADSADGPFLPIAGADTQTYVLTSADENKYFQFEVTPVSTAEPKVGLSSVSETLSGPCAPVAEDVTITAVGGNVYRGGYTYRHPHGIAEGTSVFQWFANGRQVGSGLSFDASAVGKGKLTFTVTPVAVKNPAAGQPVSASKTIGKTGSTIKSGGGGGGNRTSGTPIIPVAPVTQPSVTPQVLKIPDVEQHWALQPVRFVVQNDIIPVETDGNFYPERLVSRAEFVAYIGRALQLEKTPYGGMFADVDAAQWYAGYLQTAVDCGIISVDTAFRPNDTISRQEVAKVIVEGFGQWIAFASSDRAYADGHAIAPWARGYVEKVTGAGIMQGDDQAQFLPENPMTRAQAAAIIQRLFQQLETAKGE